MSRSSIPEYLLREVWKDHRSFLIDGLMLADGSPVSILEPGTENEHRGGPDFLSARIAIEGLAISGDIELHITPEHWHAHHHDSDARYSNVMLHVVLEGDSDDNTAGHAPAIPTLILRDNLAFDRRELWTALFEKVYDRAPELACFPHNLAVPMRFKRKVLEKFGEARLDELIDRVVLSKTTASTASLLERTYQLTMDALGYSQNRTPFRELSSLLPLERLRFVRRAFGEESSLSFEALFFGLAGLLVQPSSEFDAVTNEHLIELNARWNSIQVALELPEVLAVNDWAFFRIRPLNTPYRRLALAAALAEKYFSREEFDFSNSFFSGGPDIPLGSNSFWEERTSFGSLLSEGQSLLGEERAGALNLNVLLPAKIAMHQVLDADSPKQRARVSTLRKEWGESRTQSSAKYLRLIEQELLEGENVNSVRSEQGGLTLLRNFCEKKRCYECPVGNRLVEKGWKLDEKK